MATFNSFLIEAYRSPNIEIGANLEILTDFINGIEQPFKERKELTQIELIAESVFTNFYVLEPKTQQHVFQIVNRLTEQNIKLCHDEKTLTCYTSIIQCWAKFHYLQIAVSNICIFLTPARFTNPLSPQELERTQCLIAFAIKHFNYLEDDIQQHMRQLTDLIKIAPLPDLKTEPKMTFYNSLVDLLGKIPTSQTPFPAPFSKKTSSPIKVIKQFVKSEQLSLEGFENGVIFVPHILSEKEQNQIKTEEEKKRKRKELIEKKQLEKICKLSLRICQHYLPISWMGTDSQQADFFKKFNERYSPVAKELFFNSPSHVSPLEFQILYQSLCQVLHFLKTIQFDSKSLPSQTDIAQLLTKSLERLFVYWQPQTTPMNSLLSFMTVNACERFIDYFLNPDGFCFLLDRLLSSDPWDLEDFNEEQVPLELILTDEKLTTQLGDTLESLIQELVSLGDPEWTAMAAFQVLLKIIELKKYNFAKDMQKHLQQIKNAPCSMMHLLILYHILFHREQNHPEATWFQWQQLSAEEKLKRKGEIENKVNNWLYASTCAFLKKNHKLGGWLIKHVESFKIFCTTLSQNLWKIFQKEESIKLLILHLLQGIEKALLPSTD
jgi:hypothetical protein